jgi:predicted transposase YdaD
MRWDMAVLRESPWYQEIRIEEILSDIEMILEAKFGGDGLGLMSTITQVSDLERLKVILRNIALANTFEDLQQAF